MHKKIVQLIYILYAIAGISAHAQTKKDSYYLFQPAKVFDGEQMHKGWVVLVDNNMIVYTGESSGAPHNDSAVILSYPSGTLMPGLIEGHSHLFLHPYNETPWNDQVLFESRAERLARAIDHAKQTLFAGFTTVRDLGTEGAEYDDVGLKQTIEKGIVPGPRMIVATRAIVATGSYGPKVLSFEQNSIKGGAEADGVEGLTKEIRTQIGKGADVIKLYADYYWGPSRKAAPTFTIEELKTAVEVANSAGREVAVHASSAEGMRRAIIAGVSTIEHGNQGTPELFRAMKEKNIAWCPTLSADQAISFYRGWRKGIDPEPQAITEKRKAFREAMNAGVTICMGGDVGVYPHGDNAREMEAMVDYGMKPIDVLRSATSVNADVFKYADKIGRIRSGLLADLIVVDGNPEINISDVRKINVVMKNGVIYVK